MSEPANPSFETEQKGFAQPVLVQQAQPVVMQQPQPVQVMQQTTTVTLHEGLTAPKNHGIYGTDQYIQPLHGEVAQLLHKAQFVDVCCDACCKPAAAKKRTYMHSEQPHRSSLSTPTNGAAALEFKLTGRSRLAWVCGRAVYDNRLEYNFPIALCGVMTPDSKCVMDRVTVIYFDKQPVSAGLCCYCIPMTCCGPPVIYSMEEKFCCNMISCEPFKGVPVYAAPCDFFGVKQKICCGEPCCESSPLVTRQSTRRRSVCVSDSKV